MGTFSAFDPMGMAELHSAMAGKFWQDGPYFVGFNPGDFMAFTDCLKEIAESDSELSEWARGLLTGIAETLGVEFI